MDVLLVFALRPAPCDRLPFSYEREAKMIEFLNRLGRDVEIVVRKPSRSGTVGRTRVVLA